MEFSREDGFDIFLSAGEASGDLHGSYLVRAIRARAPQARFTCLGGPLLQGAGARVLVSNQSVAVVGLFEVFRHVKAIYRAWRTIRRHLARTRPLLVILIDFPDFNFLVARLAKRYGLTVLYYITPQVWAWRSGRVRTLKRVADALVAILPFEPSFYERRGAHVHYLGHPLVDVMAAAPSRESAAARYRPTTVGPVIGLLPGSRQGELKTLLPLLLEAAALIRARKPQVSFLLPAAPGLDVQRFESEAARYQLPLRVVQGDTHGVICACDLIITASGTVTLETAILGTPMIIVYRVSELTYRVGRQLVRVKHAGLPNLIAGRTIAPELIQENATAEQIAREALDFLDHPERLDEQRRELERISAGLGSPGVVDRVAQLALEMIHR